MEAEIARIVQLAVAPVFLIAGLVGFLQVLSGRFSRIFNRYRLLEQEILDQGPRGADIRQTKELHYLDQRMWSINMALICSTLAALLICFVIMALFVEELIRVDGSILVATLFIAAMISQIVALLLFLREVSIATQMISMNRELLD
ncbi:MAG: DUF2721 domain-containing protein [Pseudomonadota bacterium]